jgi:hypothetical protein
MLEPVISDVRNLNYFADWVELSAILDTDGTVSQTDVARTAQSSRLVTGDPTDTFEDDESYSYASDLADDDAQRNFAEQIWEVLQARSLQLQHQYPFILSRDTISHREDPWSNAPGYAMCLILSQLIQYRSVVNLDQVEGHSVRQLFEKLVEASAANQFRGATVRVGWPRDRGLPTDPFDLVHEVGGRFGLQVELLEGKIDPNDKDVTVDVISRLHLGDEGPGSLVVFFQCASGRDWRKKRGEPTIGRWDDLIRWDAVVIGAVAVPFWLESPSDRLRQFRHFGKNMLIIDRPRLMAGSPDARLDSSYLPLVAGWCAAQSERLPKE